jgi:hypothetical protein
MDEDSVVAAVRAAEAQGDIDYDACIHLSALELESLPAHTLAEPESGAECSVCLAQMSCGQQVARLSCGHMFHRSCIVRRGAARNGGLTRKCRTLHSQTLAGAG